MTRLIENSHVLSAEDTAAETTLLGARAPRAVTSIQTRRDGYDQMIAGGTPIADGVRSESVHDDGVQGWWVRPAEPVATRAILFLHGGAYMVGSAKAYRGLASQVAVRAGVATFVLDYPLAPEHPFPAAPDAAAHALAWLRAQGVTEVALVGDSAGGGLALGLLADTARDVPLIASVVVFSPWTDLALGGDSFTSPETHDPVMEAAGLSGAASNYLAGADAMDGRASPLHAIPDILPPLLLQVGRDELLLHDACRYAALAAERGGDVRLDVYEGLHHVFQRSVGELSAARRALDDAAGFITAHWLRDKTAVAIAPTKP